MTKLVFADEKARVEAIEKLGDDPSKLSDLEAIREAEIGTVERSAEGDNNPPEQMPAEQKSVNQVPEVKPDDKPVEVKSFTITSKDLPEGFDTPGKVFKSYNEAQDLIKRQTEFIKDKLSKNTEKSHAEVEALSRAEKLEKELNDLKKRSGQASTQVKPETSSDISVIKTDIQKIEQMQDELEKKVDEDPDFAFTPEYIKKNRELSKLQTKNLVKYGDLIEQTKSEIQETKKATSEFNEFIADDKLTKQKNEAVEANKRLYEEINKLDIPEFKLSKDSREVEVEYLKWRADVSLARYGRPAANINEAFEALEQLQLKNPELISKLQLMGVSADPSDDVKRYIQNCEALDYKNGWRKDPITGKFKRLTEWDPETKQYVPLILPSLKAAIQQKRLEEGFYDQQVDGAFQKGAQSVAAAASRRDMGAVELHGGQDQGQTPGSSTWAVETFQRIDPEVAMKEYRQGNTTKLDELQKARAILGLDPITDLSN